MVAVNIETQFFGKLLGSREEDLKILSILSGAIYLAIPTAIYLHNTQRYFLSAFLITSISFLYCALVIPEGIEDFRMALHKLIRDPTHSIATIIFVMSIWIPVFYMGYFLYKAGAALYAQRQIDN